MKKIVSYLCVIALSSFFLCACTPEKPAEANAGKKIVTQWDLEPSFKYDTLCFINALVGDAYYLRFYQKDYDRFSPLFTPEVQTALNELKTQKDNYHVILGAWLCNIYSVTDDECLDDMMATLDNASEIWDKYAGSADEKSAFEAYGQKNLKVIFQFLKDNNFEAYWKQNILPGIQGRIAEINSSGITRYDIIPVIEKYTGSELGSDTITVYLLYYAQPHGIRIQGTKFITDISYPFETVMGNAIHEMFHPPFSKDHQDFNQARDSLKQDPLIQKKMASQDQNHGYSTYESYLKKTAWMPLRCWCGRNLTS